MNPAALKTLDRMLERLEKQARRPRRRFPFAAIVLGIGLVLAEVLLTRLVPMLWAEFLPDGLRDAARLNGWPGLIWHAAVYCHQNGFVVNVGIAVISIASFVLGARFAPMRVLVWLAALAVILLNAGILYVTIHTCLRATAASAGIPLDL